MIKNFTKMHLRAPSTHTSSSTLRQLTTQNTKKVELHFMWKWAGPTLFIPLFFFRELRGGVLVYVERHHFRYVPSSPVLEYCPSKVCSQRFPLESPQTKKLWSPQWRLFFPIVNLLRFSYTKFIKVFLEKKKNNIRKKKKKKISAKKIKNKLKKNYVLFRGRVQSFRVFKSGRHFIQNW